MTIPWGAIVEALRGLLLGLLTHVYGFLMDHYAEISDLIQRVIEYVSKLIGGYV